MKYFTLIMCILFTGCASVKYNGAETKISKIDNPSIGTVVTANIGDHLLQKGEIVEENALQVNQLIDGIAYNIPPGIYPQIGFDNKAIFFSSSNIDKNPFSDPHQALMVQKKDNKQLCVVTVFNAFTCYQGDFQVKSQISTRGSSFQQTLIYSGRVGNKINIGYREFSNNVARPGFNNDVEHDLSVSNIIGYKGAQLEVIKADNTSITYKVIKSFP